MLVVHVHVRVRPERTADFLAATVINARASLAEPGVLRFDVIEDDADPAHVPLVVGLPRDADAAAVQQENAALIPTWRDTVAETTANGRQLTKFWVNFPPGTSDWAS